MQHNLAAWLTTAIFAATYVSIAVGHIPGLRIDRAGMAFAGATMMLATGMISLSDAVSPQSIDYKTLVLLLGMMIVIAYLHLSGCLEIIGHWTLKRIRSPHALLGSVTLLSGTLSAFLINDIVCLSMTPLLIKICRRLRLNPVPQLVALATAANIGSSSTITGNPQNIFIGSHSGISYTRFTLRLFPIALIGLALVFVVVAWVYRRELSTHQIPVNPEEMSGRLTNGQERRMALFRRRRYQRLRSWSIAVTLAAIVLFFVGLPLDLVALAAASVLLIGRVRPAKIYQEIDWSLLILFAGLFIVVHAFQLHVVSGWGIERWTWLLERPIGMLGAVSAVLSNLVSNVPAVLLLEPLVNAIPAQHQESAWLALAMSSTLAGNFTVIGSIANLIVVENAKHEGVRISFWDYSKVGMPLTCLTLTVGICWLKFVRY